MPVNGQPKVLYHVVLIKVYPDAPQELKDEVYERYQTLQSDCGGSEAGILHFEVQENLDQRKGITWVELAIFSNNEALQVFRAHPKHQELTGVLSKIADWYVGDYTAPLLQMNS